MSLIQMDKRLFKLVSREAKSEIKAFRQVCHTCRFKGEHCMSKEILQEFDDSFADLMAHLRYQPRAQPVIDVMIQIYKDHLKLFETFWEW